MMDVLKMDRMASPERFFEGFCPQVYAFVSRATGASPDDVADLVQETLLVAWQDRESFRGQAAPLTWVLGIARNKIADRYRAEDMSRRAQETLRAFAALERERVPEDLAQSRETRGRVRRALAEIGEEYSEVLILRYFHGKPVKAMAEERGESESAVASRLHRAREAFQRRLAGEEKNELET